MLPLPSVYAATKKGGRARVFQKVLHRTEDERMPVQWRVVVCVCVCVCVCACMHRYLGTLVRLTNGSGAVPRYVHVSSVVVRVSLHVNLVNSTTRVSTMVLP